MRLFLGLTWMDAGKLYVAPLLLLMPRDRHGSGVVVPFGVQLARAGSLPVWMVPVLVFGAAGSRSNNRAPPS